MREFWMLFFSSALMLVCGWCSRGFLRLRNLLLGLEWTALAVSTGIVTVYAFTQFQAGVALWHFFDVFSRLLGIPLISGLGLLKVTHGWEPSRTVDVALFAGSVVVGAWLASHPEWNAQIEWMIAGATVVFFAVLLMLIQQCFKHGVAAHGIALLAVTAANTWLALAEADYLTLSPIDHMPQNPREFYLVYVVWTISFGETYLAYVALGRAKGILLPARARVVLGA
jgi:hypothetical protein